MLHRNKQDAQPSQRDRDAGCVIVLAKAKDWNWKTIFYGHYGLSSTTDIIGLKIYRIRWKNAKSGLLRRSRSFKVIEVGTNRKPECEFLLVINSNWHPISYRFRVIAAYCSNFEHGDIEPPVGELRHNVRCSSQAHWKARSGLPISVNWTFFRLGLRLSRYERKEIISL